MATKLTEHFTLEELVFSETAARKGIDNTPTKQARTNLSSLCKHVLEPLRVAWGGAIVVTSGYRSKALNDVTPNASATSQHCKGEAADIHPLDGRNAEFLALCKKLLNEHKIPFDQLINEYPNKNGVPSWVHVSFTTSRKNRGQMLTLGGKK